MDYTVTTNQDGNTEIKVKIPKELFGQYYLETVQKLAEGVTLPGFRPGKAPISILEQQIGLGRLLTETANSLISSTLFEIFEKEDIVPLTSPNIAIDTLSKDSDFTFKAILVIRPKVRLGDWKQIRVKRSKARKITDKDVNQSIANIHKAWLEEKLNSQKTTGYEEEQTGASTKFIYDAHGNKIFINNDRDDKGKNKGVKIQTEINDEFAKAIGAENLEHLHQLVKQDLEIVINNQIEAKLENDIFEKILEISVVDVPPLLVDRELDRMVANLSQRLSEVGKTLDNYLADEKLTVEQLKEKLRPEAERNIRIDLIISEIGRNEKIEVSESEVDAVLGRLDREDLNNDQRTEIRNYLANSIFHAKTLEHIKKIVVEE